jgi:hypothetical protein
VAVGVGDDLVHQLRVLAHAAEDRIGRRRSVGGRLLGLAVALQCVEDHVILGAEAAGQDLVVDVSLEMLG